jgi:diguanylate cyclase (GGDEF)-like protein
MQEALDREVKRVGRTGQPLSLIMLDIDHFKSVNDTYGHPAGDTLLRTLAEVVQRQIRAEDVACRYGGEEFAIILPNSPLDSARRCAERIREELRSLTVEHKGQSLGRITLSLGVASFPEHGPTAEALVQAADAALYQAKRGGRDQVVLSDVAAW